MALRVCEWLRVSDDKEHGRCIVCKRMQTGAMMHYLDKAGRIVCEACIVPFVLAGEVQ